jgi:large subunit ribosomal protein L2
MKKYKPVTPSRRTMTGSDFEEVTRTRPEKSLLRPIRKKGGRNFQGVVTARHRGGGHKRRYRVIDFRREKRDVPAKVASIEYDPNRSARIALLHYRDGEKRYILAPRELKVGDTVVAGESVEPRAGNAMPLRSVPLGMGIHCVEVNPGRGAAFARSAGNVAYVAAKEGDYAFLTLPSGAVRKVRLACMATIGQVGNAEHQNVVIGKAGRMRWLGWRPKVRGTAMNPVAHPMGGGEGRSGGGRPPCSPQGRYAKGGKTRKKRGVTDRFMVRGRRKKR